jgi:hypothetical protein
MEDITSLAALELGVLLMPWLTLVASLIFAALLKDWITSFAKGIKFKLMPDFNPGDSVILDGEEAVIVSIGITTTVFSKIGSDGMKWRYVPNERIPFLKLERIVQENVRTNSQPKNDQRKP